MGPDKEYPNHWPPFFSDRQTNVILLFLVRKKNPLFLFSFVLLVVVFFYLSRPFKLFSYHQHGRLSMHAPAARHNDTPLNRSRRFSFRDY
jgi:hypothetical protein